MSENIEDVIDDYSEDRVKAVISGLDSELPDDFYATLTKVEAAIETGVVPELLQEKGLLDAAIPLAKRLTKALLAELREFLCTKSRKYADIRKKKQTLTDVVIAALALHVSQVAGVSLGAATAAAGFGILLVGRIGVGAFCKLVPKE